MWGRYVRGILDNNICSQNFAWGNDDPGSICAKSFRGRKRGLLECHPTVMWGDPAPITFQAELPSLGRPGVWCRRVLWTVCVYPWWSPPVRELYAPSVPSSFPNFFLQRRPIPPSLHTAAWRPLFLCISESPRNWASDGSLFSVGTQVFPRSCSNSVLLVARPVPSWGVLTTFSVPPIPCSPSEDLIDSTSKVVWPHPLSLALLIISSHENYFKQLLIHVHFPPNSCILSTTWCVEWKPVKSKIVSLLCVKHSGVSLYHSG